MDVTQPKSWFGWPVTKREWTASCASTTDAPLTCPQCGAETRSLVGLMGTGQPLVCVECWDEGA